MKTADNWTSGKRKAHKTVNGPKPKSQTPYQLIPFSSARSPAMHTHTAAAAAGSLPHLSLSPSPLVSTPPVRARRPPLLAPTEDLRSSSARPLPPATSARRPPVFLSPTGDLRSPIPPPTP